MKYNHYKTQSNKAKFWELYKAAVENRDKPGIIVRMGEEFDIAPCLIAKLILSIYFGKGDKSDNHDQHLNVNVYLRDTTLIQDIDLAYEIFLVSFVFNFMYMVNIETCFLTKLSDDNF